MRARSFSAIVLAAAAMLASAIAYPASLNNSAARLEAYLGLYVGAFASALTADPFDDLNYNPCDDRIRDCSLHTDPHIDILLQLSADERGRLSATFYRNESNMRRRAPLDLLGRGCGTRIGRLQKLDLPKGSDNPQWIARFDLDVESRSCLGKLRPTSSHFMLVKGFSDSAAGSPRIEVAIDKGVVDKNYLYVKEDGKERRVRIDLKNTQGKGRRAQYRVCIENDEAEFDRCVVTDKTLKNFAVPLPVPGGVAVNYTWWYDLYPNLKRSHGLYELEQYIGRFGRVE